MQDNQLSFLANTWNEFVSLWFKIGKKRAKNYNVTIKNMRREWIMAKECCICKKKIGFMEGTPFLGGEMCMVCNAKYLYLKDSNDLKEVQDAIDYFDPFVQNRGIPQGVREELSDLIFSAGERLKPVPEKEEIQVRPQERANRISYINKNHLITTGFSFYGYNIVAYHGLVSGEIVLGTGFLSEVTASFADMLGVQSDSFAKKMKSVKLAAQEQLIKNAAAVGGNAIIGVDYDYITFGNNMIGVSANGTAVEVVPDT